MPAEGGSGIIARTAATTALPAAADRASSTGSGNVEPVPAATRPARPVGWAARPNSGDVPQRVTAVPVVADGFVLPGGDMVDGVA